MLDTAQYPAQGVASPNPPCYIQFTLGDGRVPARNSQYTSQVTNEDSVLEEAMDNLREAAQRIRATQNVMYSRDMTEDVSYRELLVRLSTALAMTEAAYVEAKRRRNL